MEQKKLTIEQIHDVTLSVLKKIIEICEEQNINYYIAYGTLIGAIRHKGFIPWDDDCDIVMMRPDYERFCKYCLKNESELGSYKLLCRDNVENYPYNIARFNDMSYSAVYKNVQKYDSGVFVDIYPLDGAGNDRDDVIKKLSRKKRNLFRLILWSGDNYFEPSTYGKRWRTVVKYFVRLYSKIRGHKYFLNKMETLKKLYDFENSKYIAEMVWDAEIIPYEKKWFSNYQYTKFEDISVRIPEGYDEFLKCHYGNYMELPPLDERVGQHDYDIYLRK